MASGNKPVEPYPGQSWKGFMEFLRISKITVLDSEYIEITCANTYKTFTRVYWKKSGKIGFRYRAYTVSIGANMWYDNTHRADNTPLPPIEQPDIKRPPVDLDMTGVWLRKREEDILIPDTTTPEDTVLEGDDSDSSPTETEILELKEVQHRNFSTIKLCVERDIPVYLVGAAGTGKNYTLQAIATALNLDFYFTNSVQQEYKLTGFIDAGGVYHETEFYKAFTRGGLFFLDEIDASIPEVLVLINAAIANKYFEFPNGRVDAHDNFRVVAAGNTTGNGASELYVGRLMLDSATLDRFVVIEFDYDPAVERFLAKGNSALVNFVRSLRQFAIKNGVRMTFSYRCIINTVKLEEAGMPLPEVLRIAVFKQVDRDTLKMFKVEDAGKYYYAMRMLQDAA